MTLRPVVGPAPGRLSAADVVEAGVRLTAERGLQALTLTAVADALGLRLPSLYYHLPGGVDELRLRVADRVRGVLLEGAAPPPDATASVWERLEHRLRLVGEAARSYPGVLQYLLTTGSGSPGTLSEVEWATRLLLESELHDRAGEAYVIIHAYVTGWVFMQRPTAAQAREHGFDSLATLLLEVDVLDRDRILLDGLRALVSGMVLTFGAAGPPAGASRSDRSAGQRALRRFLRQEPA